MTLLTPTVLLMISTLDVSGEHLVVERIAFTAVGIALALVAAAIGPSRGGLLRRGT